MDPPIINPDKLNCADLTQECGPLARLNLAVPKVVRRFGFERATEIVGRCRIDENSAGTIPDAGIYDGTIATAHGYARLARHKPTGTICLFTSKASMNLQGIRLEDGSIAATNEGLQKSYIVAAYRNSGRDEDIYQVAPQIRRALARFNEDLGERSEKHFTLYGCRISGPEGTEPEVYTNGRLAYKIETTDRNSYKVSFYAPTKRKDGHFVPFELGPKSLTADFAKVSRVISETPDYAQARHDMAVHWQRISSRLWDEKSIYQGEGFYLNAQKHIARLFNFVADKYLQLGLVTGAIGLGLGLIESSYGIAGGLLAAAVHTAAHHVLDESYTATYSAWRQTREAQRRLNIEAYPYGENASHHFKIQNRGNINKLCAKIDTKRFSGDEFEWLTASRSGIMLDHEHVVDGFVPSSLQSHLLFIHQRGFSSSCTLPDPHTRLDIFQSGLIRFMHEKTDGKIVIYSRYRPDACLDENLRLPDDKIKKMGDRIVRLEYDRRGSDFYSAFAQTPEEISLENMMKDIRENLLFRGNSDASPTRRAQVLDSIRETFTLPAKPNAAQVDFKAEKNLLYMSGRPPALPPIELLPV